jgi:hypothetical protein
VERPAARLAALAASHGVGDRVAARKIDLAKTPPADVLALAETLDDPGGGDGEGEGSPGRPSRGPPSSSSPPPPVAVRAVLAVRFLHRPLARALPGLLPRNAAVMWFHFHRGAELTAVGRPCKDKDLLEIGELAGVFGARGGWTVVGDGQTTLPDGRPVGEFVAVADAPTS